MVGGGRSRVGVRIGTMSFVTPDGEVTASAGDLMTVPPGAVHTFKNASETEDCECYMTATPGRYRSERFGGVGDVC